MVMLTLLKHSGISATRNGDFMAYEGDLESELDMLEWLTDRATLSLSGRVEEVNPQMLARLIEDETDVVVLIYR